MIKNNIAIICIAIMSLAINNSLFAQKKAKKKAAEDTNEWRYELECEGTGIKGTYMVKVWSYSKNKNVAIESAKRNAVHGIIFRGFQGSDDCKGQKALVRNINVEQEKEDFFSKFFADGGRYLKFVNITADGQIAASDRYKVGKKEYKIGVIVSVDKDDLRKDLEEAGIIKGLSSGF
jgi:hypothetical protein